MEKVLDNIKIKDLPPEERPRERIIRFGLNVLSNQELIAAIFGTGSRRGSAIYLAGKLLSKYNLNELSRITPAELKEIFGISNAKACKLLAAIELGRRISSYTVKNKSIRTTKDVAKMFIPKMKGLKKEVLKGLYLNSKLHLLKEDIISIGGLNTNGVESGDVFRTAISEAAAAIILVHNHPSGDPEPSKRDVLVTKKFVKMGKLLGIEILDHIIIGDNTFVSLRESELF